MPDDLYTTRDGSAAYVEYTVYVDVGDAEDKFREFIESLGNAAEIDWRERAWK